MPKPESAFAILPALKWAALVLACGCGALAWSATDPGPGPRMAVPGGPLPGLTPGERDLFDLGQIRFIEEEGVSDGLGPRFNLDSCAGCHAHPNVGGTSPATNPQIGMAAKNHGTDNPPRFMAPDGPVLEVRYRRNPDGTPDGGVHNTATINRRTGAPAGCHLAVPDLDLQYLRGNAIFRIPTPLFGAGLIEQIPDSAILANRRASSAFKHQHGIEGRPNITGQTNTNGNDGTISRFGWKAQNKSLLLFSGEAYSVEMGVTSELFQSERDETVACQPVPEPNTVTTDGPSDIELFALFQRFLAPPEPANVTDPTVTRGRQAFGNAGCALCHTPTLHTGNSAVAALRDKPVHLYSDLLLHDMGSGLADGIRQGDATGSEFRTAPLWGVGQRLFFLHDGRTSDLMAAINAHESDGSEANQVVGAFRSLSDQDQQSVLIFLRSL